MLGVEEPVVTRRPSRVVAKTKRAVIGAALAFLALGVGKTYLDESNRLDTVAEFDGAVESLGAGELNHGLRDLLHDEIEQFSADSELPPESREIRGVLARESYLKAREAIVERWLNQAEAGKFPGEGEDVIVEREALARVTGWKPGADPVQARVAFRALADFMVAAAADSPRKLVYADLPESDLPALTEGALTNLNAARTALDPKAKPLTRGDFGPESSILETAMGRSSAAGLGF